MCWVDKARHCDDIAEVQVQCHRQRCPRCTCHGHETETDTVSGVIEDPMCESFAYSQIQCMESRGS